MYDKKVVIPGLGLFLALITLPFWIPFSGGEQVPKAVIKKDLPPGVESKEFMRANHMKLLDQWRDSVVREGNRTYVSTTGKKFEMSLTNTCLGCHGSKEEFCESCHKEVGVELYCWSCHLDKKEGT